MLDLRDRAQGREEVMGVGKEAEMARKWREGKEREEREGCAGVPHRKQKSGYATV